MKWLVALIGLFFTACAKKPLELHVMTFNIRYINSGDQGAKAWDNRRDAVASLMRDSGSDFIGVQEAFRSMLDDIHQRMPGYGEIGVGREDGRTKGEYAAILYQEDRWTLLENGTFWLSDTPDVVASSTWGNKVTRICTWGHFQHKDSSRRIYVCNAHFDHESQLARENSTKLILRRIQSLDPVMPVILMGDLNAPPENPAIRHITESGPRPLRDVWAILARLPSEQSGTFHGFDGRRNGARIDYIFTNDCLQPLSAALHHDNHAGIYPSDHYPVSTWLRLP
jgi:endonuclease/exonuclease/phosphatase family metal-dependent hydrolase